MKIEIETLETKMTMLYIICQEREKQGKKTKDHQ
jgi:hypothetical protein